MNRTNNDSLYLLLLSIHGLVRGNDLELGRDADTGGQVKYVVELAKKLSQNQGVGRVDLLTRQIVDPKVDSDYAEPIEQIADKAYIVRLPFGPRIYLRKEVLWNYLDCLSDQAIQHIRRVGTVPDLVHGHYADAGYVGAQIARLLGVPFIFTGHSLGRVKKARLEEKGMDIPIMEARYNISHRIDAEEFALDTAAVVIASTDQEKEEQYYSYENYNPKRMIVIPPGIDLETFFPARRGQAKPPIWDELKKFLTNPKKPIVLAVSRADERKNIETLIYAFAKNDYLREKANLVILAGNRDDIRNMESGSRKVLFNILYLIDKYDLYGKVAYPKTHIQKDVQEIYQLTAKTKGVFVNPALTEPFGLTLLEVAACGVPIVATNDGGPSEIISKCNNGFLIDPLDINKTGKAIQSIIEDKNLWRIYSQNGLRNVKRYYSWKSHTRIYLNKVKKTIKSKYYNRNIIMKPKSKLPTIEKLIIADIDNTLIGDEEGLKEFLKLLDKAGSKVGLGIATGRRLTSAIDVLNQRHVPTPDILITSVGSEIYYGKGLVRDRTWKNHLNYKWQRDQILKVASKLPGLKLQPKFDQREFKISYFVDPKKAPTKRRIMRHLREHNLQVKIIFSHNSYLDILPIRASKGLAVRYLTIKWGLTPDSILVAGDSGNDEEMLRGNTLGVVVANYSPELIHMYGKPKIYFAGQKYARGIIEGIEYYNFLKE